MSEYWVSQKKYWCKYCEVFIADDAPSRSHHENGLRHQGNKERFIRSLYKTGEKKKREEAEEKKELARIEREAQAAFADDVQTGRFKASSSGGSSVAPKPPQPAVKPVARQAISMANYTTARDLGIAQEEEELAAKALELQQSQGVVGQWEIVESKPSTSGADTVPQKRYHEGEDEEGEGFRVRRRKLNEGLGEIYDPGIIKVLPKVKLEEAKKEETITDLAIPPQKNESTLKWTTKRWKTGAVDEAASDGEEHSNTPSAKNDTPVPLEDVAPTVEDALPEEPPLESPQPGAEDAAPAKSMFKKRKAPLQAVGVKKGVRKQL